jgi:uncharacterized protein (DUF2126 family)
MSEQRLPLNIQPLHHDLDSPEARTRLAALLVQGLGKEVGFVLPLKAGSKRTGRWLSSSWPLKREQIFLLPGDSPLGYRLPLGELPWVAPDEREVEHPRDPFDEHPPLDGDADSGSKKIKRSRKNRARANRRGRSYTLHYASRHAAGVYMCSCHRCPTSKITWHW